MTAVKKIPTDCTIHMRKTAMCASLPPTPVHPDKIIVEKQLKSRSI